MSFLQYRQGYIALVTVLIISGVALAIAATVSLLGIGVGQSALTGSKGENALQLAEGCAEDALLKSAQSSTYNGGTITRPEGTCVITITKNGSNWTIVATSTQTDYNRTVVVNFTRTSGSPITLISWQESLPVPTPTAIPTPTVTPTPTYTPPSGPPIVDTNSSDSVNGGSWSQTVANQSNRLLLVGVTSSAMPSSVTYGGQSLTLLASECPASCLTMWYMGNPSVGTATVSVNASVIGGGSTVYYNVNQLTPFGTPFTEQTASTTSFSYSVSGTNTNQVVADAVFGFGTPVPGAGQTQTYLTKLSFTAVAGSKKAASSGSTSMSWSGNTAAWYVIAVPIN